MSGQDPTRARLRATAERLERALEALNEAMSIEDIKNAIEEENSSGTQTQDSVASKFLKAVSASCKELGHTKEAAQQARRRCFALQEYFGMHSLFVTITIDDECSFRVRLYPYADGNGEGVSLSLCAFSWTLHATLYS